MKKIVTIEFPVEEDERLWKTYELQDYQRFHRRFGDKQLAIDFMKDFTATKLASTCHEPPTPKP